MQRMELKSLIKILSFCVLLWFDSVFGATDAGDFAVLDEFRKGLSNSQLLRWPANDDDPCGSKWPHVFCSGSRVTQIQVQGVGLSGPLPNDFNKLSMLSNIGLQKNNFSGSLPTFNGLSNLQFAFLDWNQFDFIPPDFFVGLDSLQVLSLDENPLNQSSGWMLPPDLSNSAQLTNLTLMKCNLVGPLPDFLGNMHSLSVLKLSYNDFTGEIPASYAGLPLQIFWLNNQAGGGLSGSLDVIASMTLLNDVWIHGNQFSGPIPSSIGGLTALTRMWMNNNQLVGLVPNNLTSLPQLQELRLDNNLLMGPIPIVSFSNFTYSFNSFCQSQPGIPCSPEVTAMLELLGGLDYPTRLAKSWTGNDPCSNWLGVACSNGSVTVINLQNFSLNGTISPSLAKLSSLTQVLLGGNNITGTIPSEMTKLNSLKVLDLSHNNISPPVPSFSTSVKLILDGNLLLVNPGSPGSPSGDTPSNNPPNSSSGGSSPSSSKGNSNNGSKKQNILVVIVPIILGVLIIAVVMLFLYRRRKGKMNASRAQSSIVIRPRDPSDPDNLVKVVVANKTNNSTAASELSADSISTNDTHVIEAGNLVISVQVLRNATQNFASDNVLGRGGFGVVYKGTLHDGTMIAVKRMESAVLSEKAFDEFHAEIAVLSKVRHRNLVSILGYSVEDNERLLVYEYMSLGALSKHLFHWKQFELEPLSWKKRLNVALDVARGMEYLHNLAHQSFIHRDLKSSNILLSDDYRAKVSDFGLVKLAPEGNNSVATRLAGTFGYLAPEYAVTGKVSTKIDVFSFGVVLMELVTGLVALDEGRSEESRYLASWFINMKTSKEKLKSIIDPSLNVTDETFESISIIAELAGHCVAREPHQRPDMGHAVNTLAPLVDKWKPMSDDQEEYLGIDMCQPLLQMVKVWQEADGSTVTSSLNLDDSKGSIPARPAGFAESFASMDGR